MMYALLSLFGNPHRAPVVSAMEAAFLDDTVVAGCCGLVVGRASYCSVYCGGLPRRLLQVTLAAGPQRPPTKNNSFGADKFRLMKRVAHLYQWQELRMCNTQPHHRDSHQLWLIPTIHTILKLRKWHFDHPDDGLPLSVELGEELMALTILVLETAERLEGCLEVVGERVCMS